MVQKAYILVDSLPGEVMYAMRDRLQASNKYILQLKEASGCV